MEFSAVYLFSFLVNPSSKRILAPKTAEVSGALTSEAFSADSNEPASKRPRVLTVAENVLCWEHLKPHLQEFSRLHPDDNMYAPSYDGRAYLKKSFAHYLSSHVFKTNVSEKDVLVISGSGAVMDVMGTALLNPAMDGNKSDAFICITPCYNSFENNFTLRTGAVMYGADTMKNNYVVTDAILEEAYQKAEADGRKVKLLVFTNPNNPTGTVYSLDEMRTVLAFCRRHSIHLLSDEIYALSVKPQSAAKAESENAFVSFAKLIENDPIQDDVSILWGFSKDLGLSGFRLSVLVTRNRSLHTVLNELCHFCEVPANTQSFAANMLDDEAFMKEHVEILQKRVLEMRQLMEKELTRMKIPFCKGYAGFFSWIDLRAYLKEDSFKGEQELCRFLYDHGNIIVAPGSKYHASQFGWACGAPCRAWRRR
ncbi:uncharacterized protein [Blastocystis hominis]|uniref:Aminotransferase class I/classII large domain-containing protein n=1 Tax=Blastocystis hominis TaxID=12968 RepID=D8M899_BLAHO|nr:uncharacterized protein [Blastocystis hominis]CBK24288.2 unnamed protein product [Blastocystis hominis]|eukprot:XP_012898336.1 uncharacterized protein [Blastocystis hominis]